MNLNERIAALDAELEALRTEVTQLAGTEDPTDEQLARMDEILPVIDEKAAERAKAVERAAKIDAVRQASIEGRVERYEVKAPQVMTRKDPTDDLDAVARGFVPDSEMKARAATLIENARGGYSDSAKQSATQHVERNAGIARHALLVGSDAYRSAFETILRNGPEIGMVMLDDEQRYAMRAALSNTAANGGYTLPLLLDPTVILTNDGIAGSIRSISRVEVGTTDQWKGITSAGVTAEWLGEGSEAADASPTVGQPTVVAIKAAAYVFASYEQEADGQLVSQLPRLIADAKMRLDEAAFATGAGSTSAPEGVVTGVTAVTASRVTPTTGGTFTSASIADVYKVINAVPPRHRSNASWLANYTTLSTIRQMDSYGGSAFWANLGAAVPNELIGRPVYETSTMTATVTTGSNILLAGNFAEGFLVYDRVGVEMRYLPVVVGSSGQRPTGQAGWFAFWRTGSKAIDPNAFRILKL